MGQPRMRNGKAMALLILAIGVSACVRPPTIVRDPSTLPAVMMGAVGLGQPQPAPPVIGANPNLVPVAVLQADLRAKAGSDTVQFDREAYLLDDAARQTLARQADWLRANPMVRASIEGHADVRRTRNHALALGERRAAAVHSFLLAQGVSPAQLSVISWGKERPAVEGAHDAAWLQNSRVVTVIVRPDPGTLPPPLPPPLPPVY